MTLTNPQRAALVAAVAALAVAIALHGEDSPGTPEEILADAGLSRSQGALRVADISTGPVNPGDTVTVGVDLLRGVRAVDVIATGPYTILSQRHVDRETTTWFEVTARNDGAETLRFIAFVSFNLPTP